MATSLADISSLASGGGDSKKFVFKRVNDAVKGVITRTSMPEIKGNRVLIIEIEVASARGGIVSKTMDEEGLEQIKVADFAAGDLASVWMNAGSYGLSAVRDAVTEAGATELREGGTITVKLAEKRDVGKESPANIFAVKYEPPVGRTSADELDDSF